MVYASLYVVVLVIPFWISPGARHELDLAYIAVSLLSVLILVWIVAMGYALTVYLTPKHR